MILVRKIFLSFWNLIYRCLFYPLGCIANYAWLRFTLLLCEKRSFQTFALYAFCDPERADVFFKAAEDALSVLEIVDPLKFKRVQKYLPRIVYLRSGINHYDASLSAFLVDAFPENDAVFFATQIVHEATHGYLRSKGFPYTRETRERHENICLKEERRFIRKAIHQHEKWTDEEKKQVMERWNEWFDDALKTRWWEPRNVWVNRLKRLKELLQGKV
ncbi:MAG: hypothetical protein A3G87_01375 [Omnitrophica bacterium RIFCSPLOWO2_12_FULL_50_11]|nr:MAG: hypothetical protein A3G87_01375 [Omnitrophica bacterium RIFCSPLOWO2_12_FULL_50_11]